MIDTKLNITVNQVVNKIVNLAIISGINFFFALMMFAIAAYLYSLGMDGKYLFYFLLLMVLSMMPVLTYFLNKIDFIVSPMSYSDLYIKTVDMILNIDTFDEMIAKIFDFVMNVVNAESGRLIFYYKERDVFEVRYNKMTTSELQHRGKNDKDGLLINSIHGPEDIIFKSNFDQSDYGGKDIFQFLDEMDADIAAPIFYDKKNFGFIMLGNSKKYSDRELRLIKIFASKLAIVSANTYYFSEILKRKEMEKEYELTYKIQNQFLPEPGLRFGSITIEAYHETMSSLTREFYDIFLNENASNDVRISAYRVYGDVKESSIFMPGVQAALQSYARLGFSPQETVLRLKNLIKERDVLNGDLMIYHSSIKQSGEFICCCSDYAFPFIFQKSTKKLERLVGDGSEIKFALFNMRPGDIVIAVCKYFNYIIEKNLSEYSELVNNNYSLPLTKLKDALVKRMSKVSVSANKGREKIDEGEDKLLILIAMEEVN